MELLTVALNKLGLDKTQVVGHNAHGEMPFQILRERMPEGIAILCLRNKAETWQSVMELLQREYDINWATPRSKKRSGC